MRRIIQVFWIAAFFMAALVIYQIWSRGSGAAAISTEGQAIVDACRAQRTELDKLYQISLSEGIFRKDGSSQSAGQYEVDEKKWLQFPHKGKISLAISVYCQVMTGEGFGAIRLVGLYDGKEKATIINGVYKD